VGQPLSHWEPLLRQLAPFLFEAIRSIGSSFCLLPVFLAALSSLLRILLALVSFFYVFVVR
jgi:hypothetical protein